MFLSVLIYNIFLKFLVAMINQPLDDNYFSNLSVDIVFIFIIPIHTFNMMLANSIAFNIHRYNSFKDYFIQLK